MSKLMAHNSFSPGLRTPELKPSRANLPLLSTSRANVPYFYSKVNANCDFEDDPSLDIGFYCTDIIPKKQIDRGALTGVLYLICQKSFFLMGLLLHLLKGLHYLR